VLGWGFFCFVWCRFFPFCEHRRNIQNSSSEFWECTAYLSPKVPITHILTDYIFLPNSIFHDYFQHFETILLPIPYVTSEVCHTNLIVRQLKATPASTEGETIAAAEKPSQRRET